MYANSRFKEVCLCLQVMRNFGCNPFLNYAKLREMGPYVHRLALQGGLFMNSAIATKKTMCIFANSICINAKPRLKNIESLERILNPWKEY